MSSTREHLLGYLLGALEPAEMAQVDRELNDDPRLRKELAAIEAAMAPLGFLEREDDASQAEPPASLVTRTCEFVDDSKADLVSRPMPAKLVAAAMSDSGPAGKQRLRWADLVMTASICLAAVSLLFPAIWTMRHEQQKAVCQNNLQKIGIALADSAGRSADGRIPFIPVSGNRSFAGFYASSLLDQGLLEESRWLVCPSSEMAEQIESFRVPRIVEIDRTTGEPLVRLQRSAGGSYGYNMGFVEDGEYQAPRHDGRAYYCLMSDAPGAFKPTRTTKNHGGRGQNMLYEDGSCRWIVDPCPDLCDDPHLNNSGIVAAGNGCTDVVVAESLATPKPAIFGWRP